jgi:hypothetical protein
MALDSQGHSSGAGSRISAIEMKQKELDGKVSAMLLSTTATTTALEELKSLVIKCMTKENRGNDGSPSASISAMGIADDYCLHPSQRRTTFPVMFPPPPRLKARDNPLHAA